MPPQKNIATVKKNGLAIQNIQNPSEAVQLTALRQDAWAIRHIENPSEAVQLAAVTKNGFTIRHIENPSEAVQLAAVTKEVWAIREFKNPTESVQVVAVKKNGCAIEKIKNPSEALQLLAVEQRPLAINCIQNPSEAVQMAAINKWPIALCYIQNPSESVQLLAFLGGGFQAAAFWAKLYRPTARDLMRAIQNSGVVFSVNSPKNNNSDNHDANQLYKTGTKVIRSRLSRQPAADILDLAAVSHEMFEPPEMREILRKSLLKQAPKRQMPQAPRSV